MVEVNSVPLVAYELCRFYHAGDEETLTLRGVSLAVAAGETVVISGPSGSGKSTLRCSRPYETHPRPPARGNTSPHRRV